jgi:hypothetical protein
LKSRVSQKIRKRVSGITKRQEKTGAGYVTNYYHGVACTGSLGYRRKISVTRRLGGRGRREKEEEGPAA